MNIESLRKEYLTKTISELRFILSNNHKHSDIETSAAKDVIQIKREEWRNNNIAKANEIDACIRQNAWFDLCVANYDGFKLNIIGSIDLSYYHTLEITFEDIFFYSGFTGIWHSDTNEPVLMIPKNEYELNVQYEIEEDYQLFLFKAEDSKNDIIIAANTISYNDSLVKYDR